ncbi:MAG: hypothetical protein IMZ64_09800, partial [Bacteroidetes bacterium]|nr:hypothetical protein [Bacteroidota bacterium]
MAEIVSKPGNQTFRDSMDRIFGTKEEKSLNVLVYENGALKITKNPIGLGGFRFYFKCGDVSK